VIDALEELEQRLRNDGSIERDTLPTAVSVARSTLLFTSAVERAQQAQAAGNYTAAQRQIVRAGVARDQLVQFSSELPDVIREPVTESVDVANETLVTLITEQRSHYRELTVSDEAFDERARAHRALGQLASISGNPEWVGRNLTAARNMTDRYLSLVESASQDRARATATWQGIRDNATVVVAGQPLVLNPLRFDATTARLDRIDTLYGSAIEQYRSAGATAEIDTISDRRAKVNAKARFVRFGLYGSIVGGALVLLGVIGHVVRRSGRYVRDSQEAALGDFILESTGG
jgi:hypothetical protein